MGTIFAGWKKAVFWNAATGVVVQKNILSTDHSDFPHENIKKETPTGSAFGGRIFPIIVGFLTDDGNAQLEAWTKNNTPINLAVFTNGRQIVARQAEEIQYVPEVGVDARTGLEAHRVEYETVGFDPDVIQKKNVAEGITFAANVGEIVLPIEGVTWTVAADYTTADGDLTVTAYDYAGNPVATSTQALSAGRVSTSITTPADTWKIEIDLVGAGASVPSNVSMRGDGKSEYTEN